MKYLLTALLSLFYFHSICIGQSVLRGPYLQMIGQESLIIRWRTATNVDSKVWYGTSPSALNQTKTNNPLTTEHEVSLSGLTPNTKYYYAIGTSSGQLAGGDIQHYFKTSPESSIAETINIWVLGDAGKGGVPQREVRDAFYAHHGNAPIDLTLLLGDNAYNDGSDIQYQDTWFTDMYEDRLIHTTMFSSYGNHDSYTSNSATETGPYFDVFNHPKNAEIGGVASTRESWYSFDYGDIHFISLNSFDADLSIGGAQYQWLLNDLQNNDKGWLIAFWHYPPHDARNNNSDIDTRDIAMRQNYNPILEQYGVDLVLSGHSHSYQRSFLIADYFGFSNQFDPAIHGVNMGDGQSDGNGVYDKGTEELGTVYMVTGSAGSTAAATDELEHPAMFNTQMVRGSVRLQISYDELFAEFINSEGIVSDYFTIKKTLPPLGTKIFRITNPSTEGYAHPQPIIVTQEFLDTTDAISSISYYVNGALTAVKTVYPFNMNYNIPADGNYIISATALTVNGLSYTDQINFHVGPTTICKSVFNANNDAEEKATGIVSVSSSDLELTFDGSIQQIGLRYSALRIPKNSIIHEANIQFKTHNINNINPCQITIHGEASNSALSYTSDSLSISSRTKTQAFVNWSPPSWNIIGESGSNQKTPNLKNVVQQIVNRPAYSVNSAIAFILSGTGRRTATSFNGSPSGSPVLCVNYTPPYPADSDGDGTPDSEDICFGGLEPGAPCNDLNPNTDPDTIGPDCSCGGTGFDCPDLQANIGTPCNDNNPNTYNDAVNANCQCAGNPNNFQCPELSLNIGAPCNDNNANTVSDVVNENCECVGIVVVTTTLTIPIVASSDDAEQRSVGTVSLISSDLELMVDGTDIQKVGLRFQNPGIPSGAELLFAYIQFTADNSQNQNPSNIQIFGEAADNSTQFVKVNNNISQRTKTNSMVQWTPANNWITDEVTVKQRTADLTAIVEEIINRPGYQLNNPITFLLEGNGVRVATSFDGDPAAAPRLVLQYSYQCIDNDNDGICNHLDACPDTPANPGTPCNDGNPITVDDMINENCICAGIVPNQVCAKINSGSNDAEQRVDGTMRLSSDDLDLVIDGSQLQTVGLRFTGLNIPPGAIISSAYVQFTTDKTINLNPCLLSIYGEAANNPPKYEKTNYNITNRTKTNTKVDWSPANWSVVGETGAAQRSVNIAPVIQELVNRPGYLMTDAINLIINGNGTRVAMSFEKSAVLAPELCIIFTTPPLQGVAGENQEQTLTQTNYTDAKKLSIFPNPASENLTLIFEAVKSDKELTLQIVDVNGKILLSQFHQLSIGEGRIDLTGLELENGVYFVRLKDEEGLLTGQFVVVN
jgi:Calcineurin-like phosphoesterase/Secretion system C-terminal sorting domain/Purple acid Phosphatase, N-terminal domain